MLEPYFHDISCISNLSGVSQRDCSGHSSNHGLNKTNFGTLVNGRYTGTFVSPNVVSLSRHNLTMRFLSFPRDLNLLLLQGVLIEPL